MSPAIRMSIISLNLCLGVIKCVCVCARAYEHTSMCAHAHTLNQAAEYVSCVEVKKVKEALP